MNENNLIDPEISAMGTIATALNSLETEEEILRVLDWAAKRFGATSQIPLASVMPENNSGISSEMPSIKFDSLADFFAEANPSTVADKALVTGYWIQYIGCDGEGSPEFEAATVNRKLKDLGHRISNITDAFSALQSKKPQLVVQTKKSGSSRQARKKYKLTTTGKDTVESMIGLS